MANTEAQCLLVYITVPGQAVAHDLAQKLVESGLAAGANISGPVESVYRWGGEVRNASEWQIFIQTTENSFEALKAFTLSQHPHRVPCIIATKITAAHEPFSSWIRANSQGSATCSQP